MATGVRRVMGCGNVPHTFCASRLTSSCIFVFFSAGEAVFSVGGNGFS